ncbi:MAG: ABC transporter substrate-binding protein [Thermoleophilaceae bacterium]
MKRLALVLTVLACGAGAPAQTAAAAAAPEPTDLVRIPFSQDDGSLTPYSFELGYPFVTLIYDTLLWRDSRGVPEPWLARGLKRSADGRQVTIRLRDGVRWHDGRALTASDVAFTFEFMKRNLHLRFTPQLTEIEQVRAVDPLTVVFALRRPVLGFLDQPLSDVPILPRHLWEGRSGERLIPPGPPIGSGPYRLAGYDRRRGYVFTANRPYFRGRPQVDRIDVPIIRSAEGTFKALERGNVEMVPAGLPTAFRKDLGNRLGIDYRKGVNYTGTALLLNLRRPPFDNPAVRRAVALALDLDRIADGVGEVLPASTGYLHPESPWAPTPGRLLHRSDEAAARRELSRLGNPPFEVLTPENNPVRLDVGRQVVLALRRAGARATLVEVPRATLARALGGGDGSRPRFQAAITSIPALISYDPDFLRTFFGADARLNQTGYRSGAFDRVADRVAGASDRAVRRRAVAEEMRRLARDVPAIPLVFSEGAFAYRPSAYDGWVFVKGTGILDKRSFLGGRRGLARTLPEIDPPAGEDDGLPISGFGLAAAALLFAAIALSAARLSGSRARSR